MKTVIAVFLTALALSGCGIFQKTGTEAHGEYDPEKKRIVFDWDSTQPRGSFHVEFDPVTNKIVLTSTEITEAEEQLKIQNQQTSNLFNLFGQAILMGQQMAGASAGGPAGAALVQRLQGGNAGQIIEAFNSLAPEQRAAILEQLQSAPAAP